MYLIYVVSPSHVSQCNKSSILCFLCLQNNKGRKVDLTNPVERVTHNRMVLCVTVCMERQKSACPRPSMSHWSFGNLWIMNCFYRKVNNIRQKTKHTQLSAICRSQYKKNVQNWEFLWHEFGKKYNFKNSSVFVSPNNIKFYICILTNS